MDTICDFHNFIRANVVHNMCLGFVCVPHSAFVTFTFVSPNMCLGYVSVSLCAFVTPISRLGSILVSFISFGYVYVHLFDFALAMPRGSHNVPS